MNIVKSGFSFDDLIRLKWLNLTVLIQTMKKNNQPLSELTSYDVEIQGSTASVYRLASVWEIWIYHPSKVWERNRARLLCLSIDDVTSAFICVT